MRFLYKIAPFMIGAQLACASSGMYRVSDISEKTPIWTNSKNPAKATHMVSVSLAEDFVEYSFRNTKGKIGTDYVDFRLNGEGLDFALIRNWNQPPKYQLIIADDVDPSEAIRMATSHGGDPERKIFLRNSREFQNLESEYRELRAEIEKYGTMKLPGARIFN